MLYGHWALTTNPQAYQKRSTMGVGRPFALMAGSGAPKFGVTMKIEDVMLPPPPPSKSKQPYTVTVHLQSFGDAMECIKHIFKECPLATAPVRATVTEGRVD
jgi:hypothetical protein